MSDHSPASSPHKTIMSRRGLLAAGAGAGGALFLASVSRRSVARADATPDRLS